MDGLFLLSAEDQVYFAESGYQLIHFQIIAVPCA
jgi:hypothetical protein